MNTITDDQIAEIEEAAARKSSEGFLLVHNLSCYGILSLIARLREAERDAARYRWLKDQGHFRAMSMDMGGNHSWIGMGRAVGKGPTVDEAIDAAMKTQT